LLQDVAKAIERNPPVSPLGTSLDPKSFQVFVTQRLDHAA